MDLNREVIVTRTVRLILAGDLSKAECSQTLLSWKAFAFSAEIILGGVVHWMPEVVSPARNVISVQARTLVVLLRTLDVHQLY